MKKGNSVTHQTLLESSLSRIHQSMANNGFAWFTTFHGDISREESRERIRELEKVIQHSGYSYFMVNETEEGIFLIPQFKNRGNLLVTDKEFKEVINVFLKSLMPYQESVLLKFHNRDTVVWMGNSGDTIKEFSNFMPDRIADIYSTVKGRFFMFKSASRPANSIEAMHWKSIGKLW